MEEPLQLTDRVWVLPGAVNMGVVQTNSGFVAVDTGLDKQAAKRTVKFVDGFASSASTFARLVAIINTHAHADHFGGNATLLSRVEGVEVYAPAQEAPVIRYPVYEPQYLWQGAAPFGALRNKFLMAAPSPVHHTFDPDETWTIDGVAFQAVALPGHAHGQCGILVDGVFFAADAYFGRLVTDKHGLPYMVDYQQTLVSARAVCEVKASWYVPGHGDATNDPEPDVAYLCKRHEEAYRALQELQGGDPLSLDALTGKLAQHFGLSPANPGAWLLVRTTVAAYVGAAVDEGILTPAIAEGVLVFQ